MGYGTQMTKARIKTIILSKLIVHTFEEPCINSILHLCNFHYNMKAADTSRSTI